MALITGSSGTAKFNDGDSSHNFTLAAHATTTSSVNYTWPPADGSNGQFLSTNSSGALSWAAAGGGALTLIGSTTVSSNVGQVDFTGLSGYTTYFLQVSNAVPTAQPYANVWVGDSSGFDTANQEYGWHNFQIRANSATPTHTNFPSSTNSTETQNVLLFRRGVGSGTGEGFSCSIWISNTPNQRTRVYGTYCATTYLSETMGGFVAGERVASITMDRIRFGFHSGSIEAGTVSLYGVSNA